ncbi:hypothetical protein NMG60_11012035 [Bertholletia excelsa]
MASAPSAEWVYGVPSNPNPSIGVVGEGFCVPYPVDLMVEKKFTGLCHSHFDVLDLNGNLLLQVSGGFSNLQKKMILRDPNGFPILTMREKALTLWQRWEAYRGESSDASNFLFSVQRSHPLQLKAELYVYLAGNFREDICNFHVVGSCFSDSFRAYKGDTLIAEVRDKSKLESFICKGEESFEVRVYPGVDYAFIVSLLVILNGNHFLG